MPARMAGAGVSTAAVDSMAVDFTRWPDSTGIDFTMAASTPVDFTITGFSLVDRLYIPGGDIIQTTGITITTSPTPRRLGTTVRILPDIVLM
jgi:hypothetical protein